MAQVTPILCSPEMADLFRFFRQSKVRMHFKQIATKEDSQRKIEDDQLLHNKTKTIKYSFVNTGVKSFLNRFITNNCIHITKEKWEELWRNCIESKAAQCKGLVFINPNFARTYYVPSSSFLCDFDSFNEYSKSIPLESFANMKNDRYDKWMKTMIQMSSCHISMHCCQVVEILDYYCIRCPNLTRISLHYYYLDDNVVVYMSKYLPNLVSINFENSIGLSGKAFIKFGSMNNLLHLNLSGCDICESSLLTLFNYCSFLETLNISNNCSITGYCLTHKTVKNLKRLNIKDCWLLTPERMIEMVQYGLPNLIEFLCNSGINDQSMKAIASNCINLLHLDISFEAFTYYDQAGLNCLTNSGFMAISKLTKLKILCLRHVGRLTDEALNKITGSCTNLMQIILNLRHRHKLTDYKALRQLANSCCNLEYFEAVHNHFIRRKSIEYLSCLYLTLQVIILRGNELIKDDDATLLIKKCQNLRSINLDGCLEISQNTLIRSVLHARKLPPEPDGTKPVFRASLVMTNVERTFLNSIINELPGNLRIRACDYQRNKVHYNEFDGQNVNEYSLKEKFFPYYWYDYN